MHICGEYQCNGTAYLLHQYVLPVIVGNINNVPSEDVSKLLKGTKGFYVQWLITKEHGSKYAVRRFIVKPGGVMPPS